MIWIFVGVYLLGVIVVAATLQHELEAKPKGTAAVILSYPIVPAALFGVAAGLL